MHPRRDQLTESDQDRVAEVFQTHRRFLESVARQHAPSPDHVPDIVQSVGIKMCQSLNGFRGESELQTWLYRVTVNAARDIYRSERAQLLRPREALTTHRDPEPVLDPDDVVAGTERLGALQDAVDRLNPLHRELVMDILAEPAVLDGRRKSRHLARRQLRQLLTDDPRLATE